MNVFASEVFIVASGDRFKVESYCLVKFCIFLITCCCALILFC